MNNPQLLATRLALPGNAFPSRALQSSKRRHAQSSTRHVTAFFIAAALLLAASGPLQCGENPRPITGQVNVEDFGAVADGKTDNTAAFQKAIDSLSATGGKVVVPVGQFLIRGSITLKDGVTLAGLNESTLAPGPLKGSVILATAGRDQEDADALLQMSALPHTNESRSHQSTRILNL